MHPLGLLRSWEGPGSRVLWRTTKESHLVQGWRVTKIGASSVQVVGDERLWMCDSDFTERTHTPWSRWLVQSSIKFCGELLAVRSEEELEPSPSC